MEDPKTIPVYKRNLADAVMLSEECLFKPSLVANIECAVFLEDAVESSYNSELHRPDYDDAIECAIERYGLPRVQYVVANAVLRRMHDGRIDQKYKQWAQAVCCCEASSNTYNRLFAMSALHSCYIHCLAMLVSRM